MIDQFRARLLAGSAAFVLATFGGSAHAAAAGPQAAAQPAPSADTADADASKIGNADDIVVTGTAVNLSTPITASVHTFEPQAIVSRSIIEDSVPATADFSDVILLTPGASGTSNGGGPGLSESKTVLRGFQDGFFNITYDGVPFGDSNNPTHHSTAYFPDGTYERIIVDRGPGSATDLGQASFGGNIHLISRETKDKAFIEGQGVYGSYDTYLGRLTINSGSIDKLGGLKVIAIGEYKDTQTALSGSNAWFINGFIKAEKPLGDNAKLSILTSYNQDFYRQSDNNGVSCTGSIKAAAPGGPYPQDDGNNCLATSQVGLYGKSFGLVNFNEARFAGTPFASARNDFNWTNKTTDFEIARLQWNMTDNLTLDNKWYTYFYKNFTVSTESSTTPCTGVLAQNTCGGMSTKLAPSGALGNGGTATAGDIPGYTKVNQYRNYGDILELTLKTAIGIAHLGAWFEHSASHRYRYDYDFTKGFQSGALTAKQFDFAGMAQVYNYKETNKVFNTQLNGQLVPAYIAYDEKTSWDQIQGFGEFEFKLLDNRLTLTPGVKVQNFTRRINTPIASQKTRVGIQTSDSYKPTLPYFSANFLIRPDWSVYAQYAKGFLIPQLADSLEVIYPTANGGTTCVVPGTAAGATNCNLSPTRTTNYQFGTVYAGDRLNIDFDGYYIEASNSISTDPGTGISVTNGNPARYKGVEGQVSYLLVHGLTAIANGSIMSAKDHVTGLWLPQAPNYTATLGMVYSGPRFKLSMIQKFTGRQFADGGELVRIAPYSLGIASGSVKVGPAWLGVTVYNVFDNRSTTKIGSSTGATPLYFFNPGRSYQAQVKFKF
ncbi:TonB-dependent receptor [Novosphingobium sp.]|uniref:TonB-dependent receptor domain-containing protein n=1 Tax=Novosphingobium sp. TaxID=1874826 RepID=UPI0025E34279|nr:TonB-dependent receptor [Novosphingobium sp.]